MSARAETRDDGTDGAQPPFEIDDAEHRFERRGENRWPPPPAGHLFPTAEAHPRAEAEIRRPPGKARVGDELCAPRRQHADRRAGLRGEELLGDHERQRRVADEREPFVIEGGRVLVRVRGVRQRTFDDGQLAKPVIEPRLERGERLRIDIS
jgi:hypothetical protein